MSLPRKRGVDIPHDVAQEASRSNPKPVPSSFYLPLNVALYLSLISNGLAAAYAPIQDCDEVFNFWEPAHFLDHGYGLQTWEWSPEYSIRSWLYVSLHAAIGKASSVFSQNKISQFYTVRFVLAFFCAACQTRLYSAICRNLNPRIGLLFLIVAAFSPGMFHASAAFLPSSFTMYTSMLGLTAFIDFRGGQKTAQGIMWFGIGAIVGWPFAGALLIPLLLEEVVISAIAGDLAKITLAVLDGAFRSLLVLGAEVAVDFFFFRKVTVVPWNIVSYNVFGGQGRGPDIFGTEPWTFYIRNLLLNFNLWFILAMSVAPLLLLQAVFRPHATSVQTLLRSVTLVAPFYVWFAIFTVQPHKEERFMYPAYPFLALNAAIAFHLVLSYIGSGNPKELIGRVPAKLKLVVVMSFVLAAVNIGLLRIIGVVTAYNAPLKVFEPLHEQSTAQSGSSVCLGKEWYRFPSSFFLPDGMKAKFVKSEFRGLLPGEFPESKTIWDVINATSAIPAGMNDRNEEDSGKYTDISKCSFLVDSYFPGSTASELEPNYILDEATWEPLSCKSFLDTSQTPTLGRTIWIPDFPFIPARYRRHWGRYCLLKRRDVDVENS
ncbi:CAZyme family GT22 [Paecilomyces variotii]|nr:CAZyme family GT22 [Paecilomyces variotii]KAJ9320494.1 CAZyme family GT22 [Paecilomyces variotii]KAJ9332231.1 CAZyme family GT22 [Paecilomyces variotii]KAJ9348198.1 CAZyme family GT22 [Paecilomyces variotii]KAJ9403253.1 CAZyme family GT22 [Paecilomyces variotii]